LGLSRIDPVDKEYQPNNRSATALPASISGTCTGIAAAVSTTATGVVATWFGRPISFLTAAGVAALAVLLLWLYLPESRPKEYLD